MTMLLYVTAVFPPMIFEALLSRRNERALRAGGAVEPPGDVYRMMAVAYPAWFVAMFVEGWYRGAGWDIHVAQGFTLFVAAKLLKYWSIVTLGERWTFRVLVPPASERILAGPYRLLRHPNYIAVMGELAGAALIVHALLTGLAALLSFGILILVRIRVEERALGLRAD